MLIFGDTLVTIYRMIISPLRYPGGKAKLSSFLNDLLILNSIEDSTLVELYAGGAGASLLLLYQGAVGHVHINDLDPHIYLFWWSILNRSDEFIKMIIETEINIEVWQRQKYIYTNYEDFSEIEVGFSTFYLNRCNRSGILFNAGPIGGINQLGKYKIDARFNKSSLIDRIQKIQSMSERITLTNQEALDILRSREMNYSQVLFFLDPPYYNQGENLYLNAYNHNNHKVLSEILQKEKSLKWLLTYDNCPEILELYKVSTTAELPMKYTLQSKKTAKEIMIISDNLCMPKNLRLYNKTNPLNILGTYQ
ncbi:MAG: DNA adenine methylase [Candidatus Kapaibacteriales bacterium]